MLAYDCVVVVYMSHAIYYLYWFSVVHGVASIEANENYYTMFAFTLVLKLNSRSLLISKKLPIT